MMSALDLKSIADPFLVCFLTCMQPADYLQGSTVAKPFWSTYLMIMCPQALLVVRTTSKCAVLIQNEDAHDLAQCDSTIRWKANCLDCQCGSKTVVCCVLSLNFFKFSGKKYAGCRSSGRIQVAPYNSVGTKPQRAAHKTGKRGTIITKLTVSVHRHFCHGNDLFSWMMKCFMFDTAETWRAKRVNGFTLPSPNPFIINSVRNNTWLNHRLSFESYKPYHDHFYG